MKRLCRVLLLAVGSLLLMGIVAGLSATTYQPDLDRFEWHLVCVALGCLGCAVAARVNYCNLRWKRFPLWCLALSALLLVAVLIPGVGTVRNGSARWLLFGQPSELAKLAVLLFLADYGARFQGRMRECWAGFLYPAGVAGVVILLVFLEPDWGTATLIASVSLAMLAVAGVRWRYLAAAAVCGSALFAFLLERNPLRYERLLAFLDPERYREGIGWQNWHALLALGNGGPWGTFFGEGSHKNGFVPEQATDFVLSLLGEETGFAGTLLVLGLFLLILYCGVRIVWHVSDPFGQLLASGLTVLIASQALINIGVVTSSLPNKGIALPFVSYGGSNMVCLLTGVGMLLSIARHGPGPIHEPIESGTTAEVGGPMGSLMWSSTRQIPGGVMGLVLRWYRTWRNGHFPKEPRHAYQKAPR